MRVLPTKGSIVGGVGWRLLATTPELASPTVRFGAAPLLAVEQRLKSGSLKLGNMTIPIHKGETAADVLGRLEWFTYAGAPVG